MEIMKIKFTDFVYNFELEIGSPLIVICNDVYQDMFTQFIVQKHKYYTYKQQIENFKTVDDYKKGFLTISSIPFLRDCYIRFLTINSRKSGKIDTNIKKYLQKGVVNSKAILFVSNYKDYQEVIKIIQSKGTLNEDALISVLHLTRLRALDLSLIYTIKYNLHHLGVGDKEWQDMEVVPMRKVSLISKWYGDKLEDLYYFIDKEIKENKEKEKMTLTKLQKELGLPNIPLDKLSRELILFNLVDSVSTQKSFRSRIYYSLEQVIGRYGRLFVIQYLANTLQATVFTKRILDTFGRYPDWSLVDLSSFYKTDISNLYGKELINEQERNKHKEQIVKMINRQFMLDTWLETISKVPYIHFYSILYKLLELKELYLRDDLFIERLLFITTEVVDMKERRYKEWN